MTSGSSLGARMAAEMAEQPDRIEALLDRADEVADLVRDLSPQPLATTVLIARGSSDHAATTGRYLLEMATGRPVSSSAPSVQTHYRRQVDYSGCLVVAVSQSGRTPEIVTSAERARAAGGRVLAVTNERDSPLAGVADAVVALGVGQEEAVPATKTVTAQLAAFSLLAQAFGDVGFDPAARAALPSAVAALLADPGPAEELAGWLSSTDRLVTVARGLLYGAGAETALKIEETTSVFATAYSAADLRHGPIAIVTDGLPVLALAHPGPVADDVVSLVDDLRQRGADVRMAGPLDGTSLPWPAEVPEVSAAVLAVVRAQ